MVVGLSYCGSRVLLMHLGNEMILKHLIIEKQKFSKIVITITIMAITIFFEKMMKNACRSGKNTYFCKMVMDITVMEHTI